MTKKHFNAFAAALKATMPVYTGSHCKEYAQWRQDVIAVLEVCEKSNPSFNRGRFIAACGIPNVIMK